MPHRLLQQRLVAALDEADEHPVAVALRLGDAGGRLRERPPEEQAAERRRHRQGDGERCEDRGDVGDAERPEEPAFESLEEEQRHEDEADDHRREDHRAADLVGGVVDHLREGHSFRHRLPDVLAQASQDVLDVDDRVVDELADRDREPAEGHHVDREPPRPEHQQRHRERERQRGEGDEGRPHVDEEEDEDDRDDRGRLDQDLGHVPHRPIDEAGRAERIAIEHHARGQRRLDAVEHAVDLLRELERVRARRLLHAQHHRRQPAIGGGAAQGRRGEPNVGDVADRDRRAVAGRDERAAVVVEALDAGHLPDGHLAAIDVGEVAGACGAVGTAGGLDHLGDREPEEREPILADVDPVLRQLAADRDDLRDAGDRQQRVAKVVLAIAAELERRDRAVGRGERQQHHLAGDARRRRDLRVDVGRQAVGHRGEPLRDQLPSPGEILAPVELDPHDREARRARRAHPSRAGEAVDRGLDREGDERLDLVRGEPARLCHDHDRRGVEFGEDVDRHLAELEAREDEQQPRRDHHERRVADREPDELREHQWSSAWKVPSAWKCPPLVAVPLIASMSG